MGRVPEAHMKMLRNEHKPGNMAVLVQAPKTGCARLKTFWKLESSLSSANVKSIERPRISVSDAGVPHLKGHLFANKHLQISPLPISGEWK